MTDPPTRSTFWVTRAPWKADMDAIIYWSRCPDKFVDGIWYARVEGDVITYQPAVDAALVLATLPDDYTQVLRYD